MLECPRFSRVGIDSGWAQCSGVNGSWHDAAGQPIVNKTSFPDMKGRLLSLRRGTKEMSQRCLIHPAHRLFGCVPSLGPGRFRVPSPLATLLVDLEEKQTQMRNTEATQMCNTDVQHGCASSRDHAGCAGMVDHGHSKGVLMGFYLNQDLDPGYHSCKSEG